MKKIEKYCKIYLFTRLERPGNILILNKSVLYASGGLVLYIILYTYPHSNRSKAVKLGDHAGHSIDPRISIHRSELLSRGTAVSKMWRCTIFLNGPHYKRDL